MPEIKYKFSENEKDFSEIKNGEKTNYMFVMHHRTEGGWMFPRIIPTGDFCFAPDSYAVRFAKTVTDTVKIIRDLNGNVVLFRAERVIERLCDSAKALLLPCPDAEFLLEAIKTLADSERGFLTEDAYLSAEITLGAENMKRSDLTVVMRYIKKSEGRSVTLTMMPTHATNGISSSYLGACMLDKERAHRREFDAPLWRDAVYERYILSAADMNIFFRTDDALITPDAPPVHGIMRDCVIQLANSWGINVNVRPFSSDELDRLYADGKIIEVFVTSVRHGIQTVTRIDGMEFGAGKLTKKLNDAINNIQKGKLPPPEIWTVCI